MKDYTKSIAYMRQEMVKQTEPHHKPYLDAIEAMERLNPTKPIVKPRDILMYCPHCDKPYTFRTTAEIHGHGERICNNCGQHMAWGGNEKSSAAKSVDRANEKV